MKKSDKGIVTLSFDCEAKWGMADLNLEWKKDLTNENLIEAYEYILEILKKYNIPSTFAFVGAMTETKDRFIGETEALMKGSNHAEWLKPIFNQITKDDDGWFFPNIIDLCKKDNMHEIASHGYTHIPFGNLSEDEINEEMKLIKDWSLRHEINCKTLIFPRNDINFIEKLNNYNIELYRSAPILFNVKNFPKYLNTFFEEFNIFKESEELDSEGISLPGGVFINWKYGPRKIIPKTISNIRYKNILNHAEKRKRVAHFWTHPHNFITAPESKRIFEKLCQNIEKKVGSNKLEIWRQVDFI